MKTQYYTACTLDGFLADEHNNLDWLFQFGDGPEGDYAEFMSNVGALAMGSTTYEWLLDHMIREGADKKQPWPYAQPTWIFTTRELETIPSADIRFVRGDVLPVHKEMVQAANGKNVWIVGGGELVGQFHDHGLMDELIISMASVTLGKGAPLLPRRIITPPLRLVSVEKWGTGFAHLTYEVPKRDTQPEKS